MTKQKEVMEVWTTLKQNLMTTIQNLKKEILEKDNYNLDDYLEYGSLQEKLAKVTRLVVNNQFEELKGLVERGEI